MNKDIIAILVGIIALLAGALAAFLIIRKKLSVNYDDFDEFEDFDMIGDDEFFDEDEFFNDDDDDYSEYNIGSDNSIPFAGAHNDDAAHESL